MKKKNVFLIYILSLIFLFTVNPALFAGGAEEWNNMGKEFYDIGQYEDAIECFDEALKLEPNSPEYILNKAYSLFAAGKEKEAEMCLELIKEIDPTYLEEVKNSYKIWIKKGDLELKKGNKEQALEYYNSALTEAVTEEGTKEVYEKLFFIHNELGQYYLKEGKENVALNHYEAIIELDPNNIEAFKVRGDILQNTERYVEAIVCYNRVLELNPFYSELEANINNMHNKLTLFQEIFNDNPDLYLNNIIDAVAVKDLEFALKNGVSPDYLLGNSKPFLIKAIESGNLLIIKYLLDYGANANIYWRECNGPPLKFMLEENQKTKSYFDKEEDYYKAMELLLIYGADANKKVGEKEDITLISYPILSGDYNAVVLLIKYKASPVDIAPCIHIPGVMEPSPNSQINALLRQYE